MADFTVSKGTGGVQIVVGTDGESGHEVRIRRAAGYDTAADMAPPSWLYFDCGTREPDAEREAAREEIGFAYLDFESDREMSLVVELSSGAAGRWAVNDWAGGPTGSIESPLVIPTADLQLWENTIHLRGNRIGIADMYFAVPIRAESETTSIEIVPLHRPWQATIELCRGAEVLAAQTVTHRGPDVVSAYPMATGTTPGSRSEDSSPIERLTAVVSAILAGRPKGPKSPFEGGFHLVYDRKRLTYRVPHWIWAWGPAMRLLLDAQTYLGDEPIHESSDAPHKDLLGAANRAGKTSLRFFIDEPDHPAKDISTVRWYAAIGTPAGSIQYASLADSLFLAGWGWMPLYEATGDEAYREATERLARAARQLLANYEVPPQDFVFECSTWTPHTLDESGFGMVGFEELYRSTGEEWVREAGKLFIDRHLDIFLYDGPMWRRIYMRDERRRFGNPDVKGHGWIIDAYLSAYGLTGEQRYLDLGVDLADRTLECQHEDGSWTIGYHVPEDNESRDDKAGGIWAYQMRRLHALTGDPRYLESSRRAMSWCARQLTVDPRRQDYGSMVNAKPMAHITNREMAVLYSTTFYGLALLEELKDNRTGVQRPL